MIKAAGKAGSMPMLVIGLSAENARRLLDDQPILFDTTELGLPPLMVLICGGETEDQIAADLHKHFPPADATAPDFAVREDDGLCGDCMDGKCHGTDPDDCGCARHAASVEAAELDDDEDDDGPF